MDRIQSIRAASSAIHRFQILCLLLLNFNTTGKGQILDSDSVLYTEEAYRQLQKQHYDYEEEVSVTLHNHMKFHQSRGDGDAYNSDGDAEGKETSVSPVRESYDESRRRLQCDDPWFWNTFECVWLDIRNHNITNKTWKNGKIVVIIIGPPVLIILLVFLWFICMACILRSRLRKHKEYLSSFRNKYKPGTIVLPSGEVKHYPPTAEEEEALQNLMTTLVSVV